MLVSNEELSLFLGIAQKGDFDSFVVAYATDLQEARLKLNDAATREQEYEQHIKSLREANAIAIADCNKLHTECEKLKAALRFAAEEEAEAYSSDPFEKKARSNMTEQRWLDMTSLKYLEPTVVMAKVENNG